MKKTMSKVISAILCTILTFSSVSVLAIDTTKFTSSDKSISGFYLVGSEEVCGDDWNYRTPYENIESMTKVSDDTYTQTFTNIKSSIGQEYNVYQFKVVYLNEEGEATWHPGGMDNSTNVKVKEDNSTLVFTFKLLSSSPTQEGEYPEAVECRVIPPAKVKPSEPTDNTPTEIKDPIYDSDTETSQYSYVYFGHYPQSEILGDDLSDEIINANYNKYGVTIVNQQQVVKMDNEYGTHYFLVEPIKWKVLKLDSNYMLLQTNSIIDHGIPYYCEDEKSWKTSYLRSWLNGYGSTFNKDNYDCSKDSFSSFQGSAFSEDEYDICQLLDINNNNIQTSDYVIIPDSKIITNNEYGYGSDYTRKMKSTDYADACKPYNKNLYVYEDYYSNSWNLMDEYSVDSEGEVQNYRYYFYGWEYRLYDYSGISPIVKILVDSDQYYTSKPELKMGKDIGSASVNLKYDSIMYDGTPKIPSVTVTENGETLEENVDYTVKYSDNTKAGTAKVTVSGCGNYYGDIEKTFEITRKEQTISRVEDSYKLTYGDKPFRLNALTSGDGAITYQSSDENVVIAAPKTGKITIKGVGTTTVTVKAAQTDNYSEAVKEIKMIVKPQKVSGVSQKSASKNSVSINWSKLNGVSGYEIYRYNPDYEEYRLAKTVSGNITNSTITGLSSGKIYKFKIRAFVNGTTKTYGAFSSEFNAFTKPGATIVKKFKYKKGARARIEAKFKKISCTGYQVKFAKKKSFKGAKTYKTTSPKYSIMINSGKRWYVKVRPYLTCNGKTYYGSWSGKKSVKTK